MAELAAELVHGPGATERPWHRGQPTLLDLGRTLHTRYQAEAAAADPDFEAEHPVSTELEAGGMHFVLRGRIDGVRHGSGGALEVEELKTELGAGPSPDSRERARLQALLYAWMLVRAGRRVTRTQLIWLRPMEGGELGLRHETLEPGFPALESRVDAALEARAALEHEVEARRVRRRARADDVQLPYLAPRPGQGAISAAVCHALENGEHLLIEAPTGAGKTAAVLTPVLADALRHDRRVFVLTARNLQQHLSLDTLAKVLPEGAGPVTGLRARAALCANPDGDCHEEHCRFANRYAERADSSGARRDLTARGVVRTRTVRETGEAHGLCPDALARELVRDSVVTVCDGNFALDPAVRLPAFAPGERLDGTVLVLDEAHQVIDRARSNLSVRLDTSLLRSARDRAAFGGGAIHRALTDTLEEALRMVGGLAAEAVGALAEGDADFSLAYPHPPATLGALCDRLGADLAAYLDYLLSFDGPLDPEPVFEVHGALRRLARAAEEPEPGFTTLVARRAGELALDSICLDPSRSLGDVFARCHAVIGMSATLSPDSYYADLLGFGRERIAGARVDSALPAENRRVVIDPTVDTRFRVRTREAPRIARRLGALAVRVPGNCLLVFPSFASLAQVASHLVIPGRRVLRQERGMDDDERDTLLAALRAPGAEPVVLLAVAGGVFTEGIDLPGDALHAVAVVGPCLPPSDAERELLAGYCEERFGDGFDYAYAIPGMTRVIQAVGRLIRGPADRGVIALYGRRFLLPPFADLLPAHLAPGGAEELVGDPAEVAERFFAAP